VKRETVEILHTAGITDWFKGLLSDQNPSINKNNVENFKKFQQQAQILAQQLSNTVSKMKDFGLDKLKEFKGQNNKTTLENSVDFLNHFAKILNETDYEIEHDKPGKEIK
jgi:hypothetical protein